MTATITLIKTKITTKKITPTSYVKAIINPNINPNATLAYVLIIQTTNFLKANPY